MHIGSKSECSIKSSQNIIFYDHHSVCHYSHEMNNARLFRTRSRFGYTSYICRLNEGQGVVCKIANPTTDARNKAVVCLRLYNMHGQLDKLRNKANHCNGMLVLSRCVNICVCLSSLSWTSSTLSWKNTIPNGFQSWSTSNDQWWSRSKSNYVCCNANSQQPPQ